LHAFVIESLTQDTSVLLTAETLHLAEGYVQAQPLGPVPVKGLEKPIEVYELVGVGPARSRLEVAAARGLTRFVGRERELDQLAQALDRARAGHGQVVGVVGEAGVGKSRLFWEFTRSRRTHGCLVLESRSVSYGKATACLPVIDCLKSYFRIEDRDDQRGIRERVTGKVLTLDRGLEPTIAALLSMFGVGEDESQWQALDPSQRRERTFEAVKRLLLRESQIQPILLLFEDLHWLDAESQAFLDGFAESLPAARILLLVNYRPEYLHAWGSKTYYLQLRMDPLPEQSAEELLTALVGEQPGLDPLKRLLIERTEGNPFFLEECVRTLLETGVLVREGAGCRLVRPVDHVRVPATVQAVLAARIDRLLAEDKSLLQCAAVVGKDVPFPLLEAVAGKPEADLRRGLFRLQTAELLHEARLFPDIEYTFHHALTHEVAYTGVLHDRRQALHAGIVQAIERLYPDRLAEHAELLAHHALRGEAWEKAFAYLRQAGVKAARRAAYRQAVGSFERALEVLRRLPETREALEHAIDARLDLRNALQPLGEMEQVIAHLREAAALAEAIADRRRLGRACAFMSQYFWLMGNLERAIEAGERATGLAREFGDARLEAMTGFYVGQAHHALGDYRRALEVLRVSVEALPEDAIRDRFGQSSILINSTAWLILCLAELGEFAEATRWSEDMMRAAEAANRPFDLITAYYAVGQVHLRVGRLDRAIPAFERGLHLVRERGFRTWAATALASLGYAYALAGRLAEGLPLLEEAGASKRSHFRLRLAYLSEAYLLAGRVDEAVPLAERVLELSRKRRERGHEAWSLRLIGEIFSRAEFPDLDRAEASYKEAIALAEELGMRPLIALCHQGLGEAYRRSGQMTKAQTHLDAATALANQFGLRGEHRAES
jgi:tetratricopeptide (TPR) repeat protein